ncbi:SusC/RagA family TonB-linked outer membrane protein [Prolixibacter bellariivorans]|nr:SusC/RagA family TonB-linked outer membrane protein [Prolixibacter bellariivorans]
MRLTFLFMFVGLMHVSASLYSQSTQLNLDMKDARVKDVLHAIEKQSEFHFAYSKEYVDVDRTVNANFQNQTIQEVLESIFSGTNIKYHIEDRHILLYDYRESSAEAAAQQKDLTVSGYVKNEKGEPLPGATISIKGTSIGVVTDIDGKYSITNVPSDATLVFSFIGMESQDIPVNGKETLNVTMSESSIGVGEVVVTALGIKRQARSLGYSTAQVKGDNLVESRTTNLGNALEGRVAGVSVTGNATGIGGSSRVIIRGNASLTGNNQPLYVIDGVPFDNTNQGSAGKWGGMDMGDGLSNINPDDIASIQVLKGAAAAALYGYRGGNGAILITTKSGRKHQNGVGVEFNNNLTFSTIYDYRDFQKTYGQGTQGIRPADQTSAYQTYSSSWGDKLDGSDFVNRLGETVPYQYVDNWKHFYNTGINENSSLAISGKTDKVSYRFGVSDTYSKGNLPNSELQQQGINMNTIYNITKKLTLTVNANYVFEQVNGRTNLSDGNGNTNATLLYLANGYDVRWLKADNGADTDGAEFQPGNNVYFNNPYWLQYRKSNKSKKNRTTGAISLRYQIVDWMYAQGQISRDGYITDFKMVQPDGAAADPNGYIQEFEKNYSEVNMNYMLGFNKKMDEFSIDATFGGNKQHDIVKQYGTNGGIRPFIISGLYSTSNVNSSTRTFSKEYSEYEVNSIYGTANFGYKDWLFVNFTGRNDWFSTLDPDNNSYFYPSVNVSWMLSDCFKLPEWVTTAKLRASVASASNGTSPYQTMLTYTLNDFNVQGQSMGYISNSSVPNALLKPVKISEKEIGANAAFLNNRVGFDFDVYEKKTTDDIVQVSTSETSGFNSAYRNIGKIRNRGMELMVFGVPVATENFKWNTSFNISYNKSKVLYLGDGVNSLTIDGANSRSGNASIQNIVNEPYGQIVGYKYKTDNNGNRVYTSDGLPERSDDVERLGNGVYKWTGGFHNNFSYKNFILSFLVDFKFGAKLFSGTNYSLYRAGLQKATLEGRENGISVSGVDENGNAFSKSGIDAQTYWQWIASNNITEEFVYDASFVKLRELSLGYNFPKSLLANKLPFIQDLKLSLVGRNLWTILKHTPNIDPESAYNNTNGQGLELNGYPATRNIGFNLNIKF